MLRVNLLACTASLVVLSSTTHADWYSGDPYGEATTWPQYTDAESTPFGVLALTYDNFNWVPGSGGGVIDTIGGHFHSFGGTAGSNIYSAYWEIRTGMGHLNGGTLLHSGSVSGSAVAPYFTSFTQGGWDVWGVNIDIPDFALAAGSYWFGLAIGVNDGAANWFVASTYGTNGIGTPLGDNLSIYYQTSNFGMQVNWDYTDGTTVVAGEGLDPSYWINEVPAPPALALLVIGGVGSRKRRRD